MDSSVILPKGYKPYTVLDLCGNKLLNGSIPIASSTSSILLVGRGETPSVWITAPLRENPRQRSYVVEASRSNSPSVSVSSTKDTTVVTFAGTTLVRVKQKDQDTAVVDELDLRPVGLNIYKEADGVRVGNVLIKENTFINVGTMIRVGD